MIKIDMNENGSNASYAGSIEQICSELATAISSIAEAMNEDVPGNGDALLQSLKGALYDESEGREP